ncbi:hypothetical protein FGB62_138g07 [Gracilaria domingensis]|nr:hypothetical protein FGB62_138g07 [Gracilaria domingensis]
MLVTALNDEGDEFLRALVHVGAVVERTWVELCLVFAPPVERFRPNDGNADARRSSDDLEAARLPRAREGSPAEERLFILLRESAPSVERSIPAAGEMGDGDELSRTVWMGRLGCRGRGMRGGRWGMVMGEGGGVGAHEWQLRWRTRRGRTNADGSGARELGAQRDGTSFQILNF